MNAFTSPLLPALLSAVAIFVVSSVIHMMLPWHKSDYRGVEQEDALMDALRSFNLPAGDYMIPKPRGMEEMRSAEFAEKVRRGPVLTMTTRPTGDMSMASNLIGWFVYTFIIAWLAGHLTVVALGGRQASTHDLIHTVSLGTFLGLAGGLWQLSIWYRRSWWTTIKSTIDAVIYAGITGAIFWWMWAR